ncbi:MAG: hypothetical protein LUH19_03060 [Lachnospiraceae bacterium]|nr:hypothetical protein [Lachnospiraceae bacterium]
MKNNNAFKSFAALVLIVAGLGMGVAGVRLLRANFSDMVKLLTGRSISVNVSDDNIWYCVVSFHDAENIGQTYEGVEAKEGYTFYRLNYTVTNLGDRYYYSDCPYLYYSGESYYDIIESWEWEEEQTDESTSPFAYYEDACIPAGRSASAQDVIQVRDGVTAFEVSYYPNYKDSTEEVSLQITLQ